MARLTHSNPAFKRYMQMSQRTSIFVFVEGFDVDPYFYGKLCEQVYGAAGHVYEIVGAWRFAQAGGKTALVDFYHYLATTGSLLGTFQGKSSIALFLLDKDIDDLLHSTVSSDHIVYTEYYCVENYLFVHGDIVKAAAAASSMEERELSAAIGDPVTWRGRVASFWKDWVIFCVFAQKYRIPHQGNYRLSASTVNKPLDSPSDPAEVQRLMHALEASSGMTHAKFQRSFRAVARLVNSFYARGQQERLFKGKWYFRLVESVVAGTAAGRPYNSHGISNALHGAIGSTIDFSGPWAQNYKSRMEELVRRL